MSRAPTPTLARRLGALNRGTPGAIAALRERHPAQRLLDELQEEGSIRNARPPGRQVVDRQLAGGNEQGSLAGGVDAPQVAFRDVAVDGHREEELPVGVADDRLEAAEQVEVASAAHPRASLGVAPALSCVAPASPRASPASRREMPKASLTWRWFR